MEVNWNLDNLYTSYKSEKFISDLNNFETTVLDFLKWCNNNFNNVDSVKEKLELYTEKLNNLSAFDTIIGYVHLSLKVNTTNADLLSLISKIEKILVDVKQIENHLTLFLKDVNNLDSIINSSNILKEYAFVLKESKDKADKLLDNEKEYIISKMALNGSNMWTKQWQQITSTLAVSYNDTILTLPEVRNLAYDKDANIRKNAYYAELKSYEKIDLPAAFSINGIKGEVIETCNFRGYSSPLEMTLKDSRLDKEVFDAMFSAIKESLPKLQKYFIKKAQLLGHKNGLPFYDLFAPISNNTKQYTYDEAKQFVYDNFSKFSEKLGCFAKKAFDNNWIDVYSRKGKVGGAFCYSIQSIKESRILLNFSNSLDSILTLGHELGHGYHNLCLNNEKDLNTSYSMPIAETASTFCEHILVKSALENSTDNDEKLTILENDLSGTLQCIVDIYSRFLFEDEVFKRRINGFVSKDELCDIMENAQKQAYGNGLDHNFLHKYMWVCKPHYYYGDTNYYNFPYAYGVLFSKGLFSLYLNDKDNFIKKYDSMLSITGKSSLYDVGKFIGVDLKNKDFWLSSLNLIIKDIEKYCKIQL
ncbi:M3 family oligoendopeptidase [uncultured Tyzzerella sp.]|uniref:M3 family oligoendopeptidase n=1 Tax=uncultured Tyzzerella sp. TaxID=2321398 RepID=UPI002943F056|nr:M3 family oligoendopeptidase [uncultured Tyzzerella sp.]